MITLRKVVPFLKDDLVKTAQSFIGVLDRESIFNLKDLSLFIGRRIKVSPDKNDSQEISFESVHSGKKRIKNTVWYLDYKLNDYFGVPIQISHNFKSECTNIIIRCREPISGYRDIKFDDFGNVFQTRSNKWVDFSIARSFLYDLSLSRD